MLNINSYNICGIYLENLLKNEKSPYLKQHENNPVYWYAWGKKALEKAKELIHNRDLNFTKISRLLNYSNLTHLSNQFKAETGMSLTEYKAMEKNFRNPLDQII